jgi:hypothetical protein
MTLGPALIFLRAVDERTPRFLRHSLPVIYLVWALVVVAMHPLCRWFAGLKERRADAWLSYLEPESTASVDRGHRIIGTSPRLVFPHCFWPCAA